MELVESYYVHQASENGAIFLANLDQVVDENLVAPVENASLSELRSRVTTALSELRSPDREVLKMRYGIGDQEILPLEEVGMIIGLSAERVRVIEISAIRRICSAKLGELVMPPGDTRTRTDQAPRDGYTTVTTPQTPAQILSNWVVGARLMYGSNQIEDSETLAKTVGWLISLVAKSSRSDAEAILSRAGAVALLDEYHRHLSNSSFRALESTLEGHPHLQWIGDMARQGKMKELLLEVSLIEQAIRG